MLTHADRPPIPRPSAKHGVKLRTKVSLSAQGVDGIRGARGSETRCLQSSQRGFSQFSEGRAEKTQQKYTDLGSCTNSEETLTMTVQEKKKYISK